MMYSPSAAKQRVDGTRHMNSADTEPGIESELIDLSTIPLDRLRVLNSSVVQEAMRHVLERTGRHRSVRRSGESSTGERID
jgi:hypothetical protein